MSNNYFPGLIISPGNTSQSSITVNWESEEFERESIESVLLCWDVSESGSADCGYNVSLSVDDFVSGSYSVGGLQPSTTYYFTLFLRYNSTYPISNTAMGTTSIYTGPTTSQIVTPTPAPSIRITNRSNKTNSFGFDEGAIGATYSVLESSTVIIKATFEVQNADASDVSTRWLLNGSPIQSSFLFMGTIGGAQFRTYSFDLGSMTGFIHRAVNSGEEIIELSNVPLQSNSQIEFEVTLRSTGAIDSATSVLSVLSQPPATSQGTTTPTEQTTTPTQQTTTPTEQTTTTSQETTTPTQETTTPTQRTTTPAQQTTTPTQQTTTPTEQTTTTSQETTTLSQRTTTPTPTPVGPTIEPVIIITKGDSVVGSDTVGDFEAAIGSSFYIREQSSIKIVADFIINTTEAAEPLTEWYYHSSVDGIRTRLLDRLIILPDGSFGRMITNSPWSGNDSYSIILRSGLRSELLEIPSTFLIHEGFFTFVVNVDGLPSQEATTEIRITYPPTTGPTTPPPTQPPVECSRPLDVYFAIDGSGSLGSDVFNNELNFVIDTIQSFASPMNRYGYLIFASEIQANVELNMNSSAIEEYLLDEGYNGGGTEFLPALDLIFNTHFTPDNIREGASRVLYFISDGSSEGNFTMILEKAQMLNEISRVEIITVGFGNPNLNQLSLIATNNNNFSFATIAAARAAVNTIVAVACPTLPSCCQGPIGFRGERGMPGYRGDSGVNGKNGICETLEECLLTGLRGRDGMKGSSGMKGAPGNPGIKGELGAKGMTGDQGSAGQNGAKGETGSRGDSGVKGSKGSPGESGQKGATGGLGPDGEQGPQGTKGAKGDTGSPGVCDFPECVGQKGLTGLRGINGSKGFPGSRGGKGAQGPPGIKGDLGMKGSNGLPGATGETGELGDAIEKRVYSEDSRNCTTDGSLLYDPESNRIYYCSMGQYLCVGKEDCS